MATPKHTEIDLDMLTEEERAGLEDENLVDEGLEEGDDNGDDNVEDGNGVIIDVVANKPELDGTKDEDGNGDGTVKDDEAAAAAAKAAADAEAQKQAAAADPVPGNDGADKVAVDPAPVRRPWMVSSDVTKRIEDLEAQKDRIAEQWDDGELTGKEHREKLKAIDAELKPLERQTLFAEVSLNTAMETYKVATVPAFLDAHPEYKAKDSVLRTLIDAEIRNLQAASSDPFSPELLEKAHENLRGQVSKAYGVETKTPAPKTTTQAAPKREIPPTLGGIPAADATDADDGGEFAYLDRLSNQDIEKYETALAQLSDEKRDRYLSQ